MKEIGSVIPRGFAALHQAIPRVLQDAENELPDLYRPTLHRLYGRLHQLKEDIDYLNRQIDTLVKAYPSCRRLTALEGIEWVTVST